MIVSSVSLCNPIAIDIPTANLGTAHVTFRCPDSDFGKRQEQVKYLMCCLIAGKLMVVIFGPSPFFRDS